MPLGICYSTVVHVWPDFLQTVLEEQGGLQIADLVIHVFRHVPANRGDQRLFNVLAQVDFHADFSKSESQNWNLVCGIKLSLVLIIQTLSIYRNHYELSRANPYHPLSVGMTPLGARESCLLLTLRHHYCLCDI